VARIKISDPSPVIFMRELVVADGHINAGNHVGNETYVTLLNESAEQFFFKRGTRPYSVNQQVLLNSEFSVQLKSEAKLGDSLLIELGVENFHRCGCDFLYRITNTITGALVARAKFSFLSFDYTAGQLADVDEGFKEFFIQGIGNE
jgi:acyl-CoA thioester hydrolase